jgi:Putative transmembrane protein (PGPGW)
MRATSDNNFVAKAQRVLGLNGLSPGVRRIVVAVTGGTVLLVGLAMVFLPGPAFIVIPLGLAILASEFEWARRYMDKARNLLKRARRKKQLSERARPRAQQVSRSGKVPS